MAANRFWRVCSFEAYAVGGIELSCLHLLTAGARVDAAATLTCSIAPAMGAVANLQDDDLATSAYWAAVYVQSLALQWDFGGAGAEIDDIRLGGSNEWRFPLVCKLQWSNDAVDWTDSITYAGLSWPGAYAKTASPGVHAYSEQVLIDDPVAYWKMSEPTGDFLDAKGRYPSPLTGAALRAQAALFPASTGSVKFAGGGSIETGVLAGHTGSLTYEAVFCADTLADNMFVAANTTAAAWGAVLLVDTTGALSANVVTVSSGPQQFVAASPAGAVVAGAPSLITLRWESGVSLTAYINGVEVGRANTTTSGLRDLGGGSGFSINGFQGIKTGAYRLSDVAIYATALSPARIAAHAELFQSILGGASPVRQTVLRNAVKGRVATRSAIVAGAGPVIDYGRAKVPPLLYLGIETGAVKDLTTGVLGQGIGRVRATVKLKNTPDNTPLKRRIRLIRERDGLQVRETWSDAVTGVYDFPYIDELQTWTVVSYDYLHGKRAVIVDNLTLANGGVELMP